MSVPVLYVLPALPVGGSELQFSALIGNIDRSRFAPRVACVRSGGVVAERIRALGVDVDVYGFRSAYDPGIVFRVARDIARHGAGILHTCMFGFDALPNIAGRLSGVRGIVSSRRECAVWKRSRHRLFQDFANIFVDKVVANSDAVRRFVLAQERISPAKVSVIPNGIDTELYAAPHDRASARRDLGLPADAAVAVTVANFGASKGHLQLLEASAHIIEKVPRIKFVLVGDGPLYNTVKSAAAAMGISERFLFTGSRDDVPRLLAASDIFVFPSLIEGMPNAVLEALCAGLPVVASAVGGIPEVVADGVSGLLVRPGDATALGEAVVRLAGDAALRGRIGSEGRRAALGRFSLRAMAAAYERLYESLLA
ncbi:MAG TPA: glycosyltransferase [bacterium]|nr:glycosyltransferase [bacterium]